MFLGVVLFQRVLSEANIVRALWAEECRQWGTAEILSSCVLCALSSTVWVLVRLFVTVCVQIGLGLEIQRAIRAFPAVLGGLA